jgi:hypothetical protein
MRSVSAVTDVPSSGSRFDSRTHRGRPSSSTSISIMTERRRWSSRSSTVASNRGITALPSGRILGHAPLGLIVQRGAPFGGLDEPLKRMAGRPSRSKISTWRRPKRAATLVRTSGATSNPRLSSSARASLIVITAPSPGSLGGSSATTCRPGGWGGPFSLSRLKKRGIRAPRAADCRPCQPCRNYPHQTGPLRFFCDQSKSRSCWGALRVRFEHLPNAENCRRSGWALGAPATAWLTSRRSSPPTHTGVCPGKRGALNEAG